MKSRVTKYDTWQIDWEGHNIKVELEKEKASYLNSAKKALYVDGKCIGEAAPYSPSYHDGYDPTKFIEGFFGEGDEKHKIECNFGRRTHMVYLPQSKSFIDRVVCFIFNDLLFANHIEMHLSIDDKVIYHSLYGDEEAIYKAWKSRGYSELDESNPRRTVK